MPAHGLLRESRTLDWEGLNAGLATRTYRLELLHAWYKQCGFGRQRVGALFDLQAK